MTYDNFEFINFLMHKVSRGSAFSPIAAYHFGKFKRCVQ